MKRISLLLGAMFISLVAIAQPKFTKYAFSLDYFLPKSLQIDGDKPLEGHYNPAIPTPKEVLGFELGERHCEWSDILRYVEALDKASDRISLVELGRSYEMRRFVQLVITSPQNHANLDQIKADHLKLLNPAESASLDTKQMPLVADITCSIHGNEATGANASLAMAYFFAASEDAPVLDMLDNMVLLLMPGANPDGINRFATWCNTSAGVVRSSDMASRDNKETWPTARSNHYWSNANRDLLMCQHPEGRIGVSHFLDWHPNLLLDLHEKGGKSWTFFHSPGHPLRLHPYVTTENQALTGEVGNYIAKALTPLGAKPYCGKDFDDFYLGKGAAYGDIHGSVCLLFEQPNTRNFYSVYDGEVHLFPEGIRNQMYACVAALGAGYDMREKLLNYQREFYQKSATAAESSKVHGYIFQASGDRSRAYRLLENLSVHRVEVYHLAKDVRVGKENFAAGEAYVIPLKQQKYFYKTKALWETLAIDSYADKTFYDITTWTFPLAYNVEHAELTSVDGLLGERAELNFPQGTVVGGRSNNAYIFEATELYSANVIRALQMEDVTVKVARKPFKALGRKLGYGTAVVEVAGQAVDAERLYNILAEAAKENGVDVYAADAKFKSDKLDLATLQAPKVSMLAGPGVNADSTGEMWVLLNQHYGIAPSMISSASFSAKRLSKYNVFIVANSTLAKSKEVAKVRKWVEDGGTLIATQDAYKFVNSTGLAEIEKLSTSGDKSNAEKVRGFIINSTLDTTTPLGYGYASNELPTMKRKSGAYAEPKGENVVVPMRHTEQPHLSGYISQKNLDMFASTPSAMVFKCGAGRVIYFADDINFRSYWYGGSKLMMNAIYFGQLY